MKRILSGLVFCIGLTGVAHAVPVELVTNDVNKWKFTNFENVTDVDNSGTINTGDIISGIMILTDINNFTNSVDLSAQLHDGTREVTGAFHLTVTGPGFVPMALGVTGRLDFTMLAGDFIRLYVEPTPTAATKWLPEDPGGTAAATARATDGNLWFETLGSDYIEGNNTTDSSRSVNQNWVDLTTNQTGYGFTPLIWPETTGTAGGHLSMVPNGTVVNNHLTGHVSDLFFETKLETIVPVMPKPGSPGVFIPNPIYANFKFKSEDPVYTYVTSPIPEPGTLLLMGSGLLGLAGWVRRTRKQS